MTTYCRCCSTVNQHISEHLLTDPALIPADATGESMLTDLARVFDEPIRVTAEELHLYILAAREDAAERAREIEHRRLMSE